VPTRGRALGGPRATGASLSVPVGAAEASAPAAATKGGQAADRLRSWLPPLIGVLLFAAALYVLRRELHAVSREELIAAVAGIGRYRLLLAFFLTAANYAILTGYDQLAFAYVGNPLSRRRIALASFVAYAISNNVGVAALSGSSVRYRFYTRWGVGAAELPRIVLFYSATFWLGLLVLGGLTLIASPLPGLEGGAGLGWARLLGMTFLSMAAAYALLPLVGRGPLRLFGLEIKVPPGGLVASQFLLSILDWIVASSIVHVLLPPAAAPFTAVVGAFVAAQVLGLMSHLPGGLGVFESVMVVLLRDHVGPTVLLPVLLVYRLVYYLLPLATALLVLLADELGLRRAEAERMGALFGEAAEDVAPRVLAVFTFLAGAALLLSQVTSANARLSTSPSPAPVEAASVAAAVSGAGLMLLSHGVARRLATSHALASSLLLVGLAASVLEGVRWKEAAVLAALFVIVAASRWFFVRKASFFAARFSPGWTAAVLAVVVASFWLRSLPPRPRFRLRRPVAASGSRPLRGPAGAALVLVGFGVLRLLRRPPPPETPPAERDLADAEKAIAQQRSTLPYLVYLRDKAVLFSASRDGFVMYAVSGATWVALGDPVGAPETMPVLIREFLERCDDFRGVPAFYLVAEETLHRYSDFGLSIVKLGDERLLFLPDLPLEETRQPLSLAGPGEAGWTARVAAREEVPGLLAELREVDAEWRSHEKERAFAVGFFDPDYVARFPVVLVETSRRVEAFALLWPGPGSEELSLDLLRYRGEATDDVTDALLTAVLAWGRRAGYHWFRSGLTFLGSPDLGTSRTADTASPLGRGPSYLPWTWQPRYLAYPADHPLPRLLSDLAALTGSRPRRLVPR
jgi:phosphatidylglycerol lysyltransferase